MKQNIPSSSAYLESGRKILIILFIFNVINATLFNFVSVVGASLDW